MNDVVLCQVVNWSLIHVYTGCHTGFYLGRGGYTQQAVWGGGGTALQMLKGVLLDNFHYFFDNSQHTKLV